MNQLQRTYFFILLLLITIVIFLLGFNYFRRSGGTSTINPTNTPSPITTISPTSAHSQIQVNELKPNDSIKSPLSIKGKVDSSWMFEGVFPLKLYDANRKLIIQTLCEQVELGAWTQPGMIDFQCNLTFKTTSKTGYLLFEADNPRGEFENPPEKRFEIPVVFTVKKISDTSKFCGGIANIQCPTGYTCQLDGNYPDAGGKCIDDKNQTYQCPVTPWIDCMPIVPEERRYQCEKPYLDWVKINCPNFQGVAL